jgi:hypothetical protein
MKKSKNPAIAPTNDQRKSPVLLAADSSGFNSLESRTYSDWEKIKFIPKTIKSKIPIMNLP